MRIRGIPGVSNQAQLREHMLENGCFNREENERIYEKWFTGGRPRDTLFDYVAKRFDLVDCIMADVGCGYGAPLLFTAPGSYGIDIEDYQADFARSVGLTVHARNVLTEDLSDLPRVAVVWCAATLEHVDSPHVFLRKLYSLLNDHGRLFIEVPCALPARWMRAIPGAQHVYGDHDDHINSFSPTSLARTCECAGFVEQTVFRYSIPLINRIKGFPVWLTRIPPFSAIAESIVYVGRQVPQWQYPPKSSREVADNASGYRFRGMFQGRRELVTDEKKAE